VSDFRPQAALFDMDGLMLDTERPAVKIWVEAARACGQEITGEIVRGSIGISKVNIKELYLNKFGPDFPFDEIRQEAIRRMRQMAAEQGIDHRPGLLVLLDHLAARGIPLAVATSTDRKTASWKLEKAGIRDRFAAVVCGDEVLRGKPDPEIFLRAAERLGRLPPDCVGFEDSPAGLLALQAAKIPSVFIKDLLDPSPEILAGVWRRYDSLDKAVELFP
jgi:HAD superfamily hydrolase (TIGR01509 family)